MEINMEKNAEKVYDVLAQLGINYHVVNHPPVYTCNELEQYIGELEGVHCKNLLLRNKKGNRHFLVVLDESKQMDIKNFGKSIEISNLSFASEERLQKYLGVSTGAVSVFGVINNADHDVEVFIDQEMMEQKMVNCHPNDNTATISLKTEDLKKFLDQCGNAVNFVKI